MEAYQADHLDAASGELGLQLGEGAQLGGADGSEVIGMGEQDDPIVADEVVEGDGASRGLSLEVGGRRAETEAGCQYSPTADSMSYDLRSTVLSHCAC